MACFVSYYYLRKSLLFILELRKTRDELFVKKEKNLQKVYILFIVKLVYSLQIFVARIKITDELKNN